MTEQEPIKIMIPVEEEQPLKVEKPQSDARTQAGEAGKKLADAARQTAQKAWDSDVRRRASQKAGEIADRGVRAASTRVADAAEQQTRQTAAAMQERVRQTDWQHEAKTGLAGGLKWLSRRLAELSERVSPPKKQD